MIQIKKLNCEIKEEKAPQKGKTKHDGHEKILEVITNKSREGHRTQRKAWDRKSGDPKLLINFVIP